LVGREQPPVRATLALNHHGTIGQQVFHKGAVRRWILELRQLLRYRNTRKRKQKYGYRET
jgi:hypothetical protein